VTRRRLLTAFDVTAIALAAVLAAGFLLGEGYAWGGVWATLLVLHLASLGAQSALPRGSILAFLALVARAGVLVLIYTVLVVNVLWWAALHGRPEDPGLGYSSVFFWLFTIAIVGGALGVVGMRNIFHSAVMLVLTLSGVAGLYILLNAEFLAVVQILIYVGGITVLIVFAVVVSQKVMGEEMIQSNTLVVPAGIFAAVLFSILTFSSLKMMWVRKLPTVPVFPITNTKLVGWSLMATYALPFEIVSVILLMVLIGAVVIARKEV
jgi:NADH:ubiquinone oxidoreductase subunit 6 (subunit J)